jgi:hypothetical protein
VSDLTRLALALAGQAAVRHNRQAAGRMAIMAAATLAAVGCGIAALGCGLAALWIYLVPRVGAVGAPLVVAGVLLAIGLAVLAGTRYAVKPRRSPPRREVLPTVLLAEATRQVRHHKGSMLLAAVIAGLVAGVNEK